MKFPVVRRFFPPAPFFPNAGNNFSRLSSSFPRSQRLIPRSTHATHAKGVVVFPAEIIFAARFGRLRRAVMVVSARTVIKEIAAYAPEKQSDRRQSVIADVARLGAH